MRTCAVFALCLIQRWRVLRRRRRNALPKTSLGKSYTMDAPTRLPAYRSGRCDPAHRRCARGRLFLDPKPATVG